MKSPTNTLLPLLDFLLDLMPPSHITLVGAGNGKGVWVQWLNAQAAPVTLVEADEQQFAALQRQQAAGNFAQTSLVHSVVAADVGEVAFYTSSLTTESGLLPSEDLQQLWPNVHTLQSGQRKATSLAQLLSLGQASQWLLLDCLPAAALVHGAASILAQIDVIAARVLLTKNQKHPIPGTTLDELAALLPDFTQLQLEPSRHPDIAYALFVRDYRSAIAQALKAHAAEQEARRSAIRGQEALQAQLQQAQHENAELLEKQELQTQALQALEADLTKVTQAHAAESKARQTAEEALQEQLSLSKAVAEKQSQEQDQQLEQLGKARDEQAKLAQERQAQIEQLTQAKVAAEKQAQELQLQIQKYQEQLRAEVEQKSADMQTLFKNQADELVRVRKSLDASLKKEIVNATRQIQAFTGLENYWRTGNLPTANTEGHAWSVSPDFSLYVVTLLEKNDYDMVIEFGSGVSTVVIAKALAKIEPKRAGKFPVVFVSFDHLEKYYQQTLSMLRQAALASYVQLHHAPLEDWQAENGEIYHYYSCQNIFAALTQQWLPAGLRVLVVVDGPPGATGPHARYPAAPLVLQYFAGANIDFLLDDYVRKDEREIALLWQDYFSHAGMQVQVEERKLEKDACLIKILPRAAI